MPDSDSVGRIDATLEAGTIAELALNEADIDGVIGEPSLVILTQRNENSWGKCLQSSLLSSQGIKLQ